jgi:hypothetical protein
MIGNEDAARDDYTTQRADIGSLEGTGIDNAMRGLRSSMNGGPLDGERDRLQKRHSRGGCAEEQREANLIRAVEAALRQDECASSVRSAFQLSAVDDLVLDRMKVSFWALLRVQGGTISECIRYDLVLIRQ